MQRLLHKPGDLSLNHQHKCQAQQHWPIIPALGRQRLGTQGFAGRLVSFNSRVRAQLEDLPQKVQCKAIEQDAQCQPSAPTGAHTPAPQNIHNLEKFSKENQGCLRGTCKSFKPGDCAGFPVPTSFPPWELLGLHSTGHPWPVLSDPLPFTELLCHWSLFPILVTCPILQGPLL